MKRKAPEKSGAFFAIDPSEGPIGKDSGRGRIAGNRPNLRPTPILPGAGGRILRSRAVAGKVRRDSDASGGMRRKYP